jgi:hypothetical protein
MINNLKTFESFTKTLNELALSKEDFSRFDHYFVDVFDFKKSLKNFDGEIKKLISLLKNINTNEISFDDSKYKDNSNYEILFGTDINALIFSIKSFSNKIRKDNVELYEYICTNYFNGDNVRLFFDITIEKDRFNKFHFPIDLPQFLKNIGLGKKIILSAINNFDFLYFNSKEDSKELKMVVDYIISLNHIYSFMLDNKIFVFKDNFNLVEDKLKEIFNEYNPIDYSLDIDFKNNYDISNSEFLTNIYD